jgi:hypothetical protein
MTEALTRFVSDVRLREPSTEKRERPRAILVERASLTKKLPRAALVSATTDASG